MRLINCTLILACAFFIGMFSPVLAQKPGVKELEVKSVFLFNFIQFVEWPDSVFERNDSPIIIGVLGDDPFGKILDETVQSEKIGGHPIIIKRSRSLSELGSCHALFISASEKDAYPVILRRVEESPILTVSDIDGFGDHGGDIGFYMEDDKIRFEINMQAIKQADLKVSSKLLRLGKVINPL